MCGTVISTYGVRQHPGSYGVSQHPVSYGVLQHSGSYIRRTPASRFIRWLCVPLFSSSANRCQHRPPDTTHQACELYTQVRQSHWFSLRWNGGFSCLLQKVIKQSDSPCLLQSTRCVCVYSRIPLVCSSCACSRDNVSVWVIWYSVKSRSTKCKKKQFWKY